MVSSTSSSANCFSTASAPKFVSGDSYKSAASNDPMIVRVLPILLAMKSKALLLPFSNDSLTRGWLHADFHAIGVK
jgi:hypothetical protein